MAQDYPWYEIVENSDELMQGDLIFDCPVIAPFLDEAGELKGRNDFVNLVILSQSCDLKHYEGKGITNVLTCKFCELEKYEEENPIPRNKKESIRKGAIFRYRFLNECRLSSFDLGVMLVDFQDTFTLPIDIVVNFVKDQSRIRIRPPYREHLAQAFALCVMRVGLPVDIEEF